MIFSESRFPPTGSKPKGIYSALLAKTSRLPQFSARHALAKLEPSLHALLEL
jgi:hypothetical protein